MIVRALAGAAIGLGVGTLIAHQGGQILKLQDATAEDRERWQRRLRVLEERQSAVEARLGVELEVPPITRLFSTPYPPGHPTS